ncbi:MAG: GNAT family N-acetyltransferase [Bacteroidetes bacterium CHB5]|nr:GNAT family N-acetyltransferase [Bacteroidetes bacterium CHB5]
MSFKIEPLDAKVHVRDKFTNQHSSLQNYIRSIARQDIDRDLARCFVLVDDEKVIKGYYTLNNLSVPCSHWDEAFRKKHKLTYQAIPCTLIGRLAMDSSMQGKGYGEVLLFDSLKRAYDVSKAIASFAVVVDSIDQAAKAFYKKYEFHELMDTDRLYLPMKTIHSLVT